MSRLEEAARTAWANAFGGGYKDFLLRSDPEAVAWDMMERDADVEALVEEGPETVHDLVEIVRQIQDELVDRRPSRPLPEGWAPGMRVVLLANEAEGWPEERGVLDSDEVGAGGCVIVTVDPEFREDQMGSFDDGLRELNIEQLRPEKL